MLHSHSYLINILLPSCAAGGNDCLHCVFIAVKSRNIHCILQPHKYPLNVTLFPLVMSKFMKNAFWIWTQTFWSDALPPSLCDGIACRYNSASTCTHFRGLCTFLRNVRVNPGMYTVSKTGRSSDLS
jgi:hypothetical protein